MITRTTIAPLVAAFLTGCVNLTDDQAHLLAKARSIDSYPVKRQVLLGRLGLEGLPSERLDGSVRSNRMSFTESWEHRSGLTVTACDREGVGEFANVPGSIDWILNNPGRKASDFVGTPYKGPAPATFDVIVVSKGDKVLYRSTERQGDPSAAPNRSAAPSLKSELPVRGSEG